MGSLVSTDPTLQLQPLETSVVRSDRSCIQAKR